MQEPSEVLRLKVKLSNTGQYSFGETEQQISVWKPAEYCLDKACPNSGQRSQEYFASG